MKEEREQKMKMKEWIPRWLAEEVKPTVKERTYARYAEITRHHLMPHLGDRELADITPGDMQEMIANLSKKGNLRTGGGLSPSSVNAIVTVAQCALKAACRRGYIPSYTADRVRRPRQSEKEIGCFTSEEQKRIEHAVFSDRRPKMFGIVLALYTGLRIGELLALEWEDIDFEKGELSVSKSCHDAKKNGEFRRVTDTPKTLTSRRIVPIPRQILPLLREQKKKSRTPWVVGGEKKNAAESPLSVRSYQYSFSLLLKRLGIPHRGFHALRHTFATRALECGMDVKTLAEILGHKNPTVTLNRYVHSLLPHKHEMMNKLGKLL